MKNSYGDNDASLTLLSMCVRMQVIIKMWAELESSQMIIGTTAKQTRCYMAG